MQMPLSTNALHAPGSSASANASPLSKESSGIAAIASRASALALSTSAVADSVAALPVSIAGLGVREKSIELILFKWYAVAPALAVKASLTGLVILALWAAIGVASFPLRTQKDD